MTVYYVKLVTGEEIVGTLVRHGDDVAVLDPMTMEYGESETGTRFIFMVRYNQYAVDKTIFLRKSSVVFMSMVLPEVERYYSSSLDHCKRVTDVDFKKGLARASQQVSSPDVEVELDDESLAEILQPKTLH